MIYPTLSIPVTGNYLKNHKIKLISGSFFFQNNDYWMIFKKRPFILSLSINSINWSLDCNKIFIQTIFFSPDILRGPQRSWLRVQWHSLPVRSEGQQWDCGAQRGCQTWGLQGTERWHSLCYRAYGLGSESWERNWWEFNNLFYELLSFFHR